jgi:hypothetical protein
LSGLFESSGSLRAQGQPDAPRGRTSAPLKLISNSY